MSTMNADRLLPLQLLAKYLAHQRYAPRSVDLISETIFLIRALRKESFKIDEVVEMSDNALDFLYECIQGPCESNQKLLVDRKITDALKIILDTSTGTYYLTDNLKREELLKRAGDAVQICIGLIEGDKPALHYPFTSLIVHNISFEAVIKLMVEGYKHQVRSVGVMGYPDLTVCGFEAYKLLTQIGLNSDYGAELISQAWKNVHDTIDKVSLEKRFQDVDNAELKAHEIGLENLNRDDFVNLLNALHHTDYAFICSDKNLDGKQFADMEAQDFQNLVVDKDNVQEDIRNRLEERAERIFQQIRSEFPLQRPRRACCSCFFQKKNIVIDYSNLTNKTKKFYESRTLSIEVANKNDELERVYFPKLPLCDSLPEPAKESFHDKVDRSSSHTKTRAFFQEFRALLLQTENAHQVKKNGCLSCLNDHLQTLYMITFIMMIVLNLALMIIFDPRSEQAHKRETMGMLRVSYTGSNNVLIPQEDENPEFFFDGELRYSIFIYLCFLTAGIILFTVSMFGTQWPVACKNGLLSTNHPLCTCS